jgi:hypothetical protein
MIISHFKFEDKLFNDTIMDGEMVKMNDGSWSFLLNDLVVLKGVHLTDHNIVKRINMLYDVLANAFVPDTNDISRIGVKRFFKYDEGLDIIHKHINEVQYSCRGIYFKPLFLKFREILINFNDELVKKVERTKYKHMKSFMMHEDTNKLKDSDTMSVSSDTSSKASSSCSSTKTSTIRNDTTVNTQRQYHTRKTNLPDVYEMFDNNMVSVGFASVPSLKISKFLRETFKNKNIVDSIILSYTYSDKHQKWSPVVV